MPKNTQPHEEVLVEYLQDPRDAAAYLNAALEDSDEMFLEALRDIANAARMAEVARRAGVTRQAMYRMLADSGNPTYGSLTRILRALGLRIAVEADIIHRPSGGLPQVDEDTSTRKAPTRSQMVSTQKRAVVSSDQAMAWHPSQARSAFADTGYRAITSR